MAVDVPGYLREQTLSKIRKFIRFVERESDTPDELDKMKAYLLETLPTFEPQMKLAANKAVDAHTMAAEQKPHLDALLDRRAKFKKNSPPYKALTAEITAQKQKISALKAQYRDWTAEFNRLKQNNQKFEKLKTMFD